MKHNISISLFILAAIGVAIYLMREPIENRPTLSERGSVNIEPAISTPVDSGQKQQTTAATKPSADILQHYMCKDITQFSGSKNDPFVASSESEAVWMAARGFPSIDEVAWAKNKSSEEIFLKAKTTNSIPLRMLGLEKKIDETKNIDELAIISDELFNYVGKGKKTMVYMV